MVNDISLQHSRDGMSAQILIPRKMKGIKSSEVVQFLNNRGVVHGVDEKIIKNILTGCIYDRYVEIAKGDPPRAGKPARIEFLVDFSAVGRPQELESGKVDLKSLRLIINVKKGAPLAKRVPPVPGTDGLTVFGKTIPAAPVKDVALKYGAGTVKSENDSNLLLSSADGYLSIEHGVIEVKRQKEINGDIDYKTGNIAITGDLRVNGTLKAGFKIETSGSVLVEGEVEGGEIKCGGSIEIKGGAAGAGSGVLECKGDLKVRYLSGFTVRVGGDCTVLEHILHSSISALGMVRATTVVGGNVQAASGIDAKTIGSSAETRTVLDIENKIKWTKELENTRKELTEVLNGLSAKKTELYGFVRDFMNELGILAEEEHKTRYEMLKYEVTQGDKKARILGKRSMALEELILKSKNPMIRASKVYPRVLIRMGCKEREIKDICRNIIFQLGE
ncbi:hypothetical protein CHISP_1361 [Chitinispirillum alkaliphilum]|nr:hypothetical protein CHISP_1361 [Chitinispirillum alkaliphilum]